MNDLLTRTWHLLQGNWILLSVLILETLVMLIFKGGQVGMSPDLTLEMALYFFHLAVLGGWLFQMKAVIVRPEHRTSWDDFFTGVARYFGPLLGGGAMFMLVCLLALALAVALAGALAGPPDMKLVEQTGQLMQAGKTEELQKLMQQHAAAFEQLSHWLAVVLSGAFMLGIYTLTLCFWTHWCVLADSGWIAAWRTSQQTLIKHWKPMLWLGMVWTVPTLLIYAGLFSGASVISMVAFFVSLLAKTYFTLLFCLFLKDAEPDKVTPLPAPTPNP